MGGAGFCTPTPASVEKRAWGQQEDSALHKLLKSERLLRELQAVGIAKNKNKREYDWGGGGVWLAGCAV